MYKHELKRFGVWLLTVAVFFWQSVRECLETTVVVCSCQSVSGVQHHFLVRLEVIEAAMVQSCVTGLIFHDVSNDR